jgi:acyl-CoA thioester hydrolase
MQFETTIRVRYAETDAMGIVHHSRYFVWLETARVEWLKSCGLNYKKLEQDGFFIPVVEANLTYRSPSFFDDEIHIKLSPPQGIQRVRFMLTYELFRDNAIRIANGYTIHVFLNKDRRLITPPSFFIKILES